MSYCRKTMNKEHIHKSQIPNHSANYLQNTHWRGNEKTNLKYNGSKETIPDTPNWLEYSTSKITYNELDLTLKTLKRI